MRSEWLAGWWWCETGCVRVCLSATERIGEERKKLDERMCVKGKRRWCDALLIYRGAFLKSRLGAA